MAVPSGYQAVSVYLPPDLAEAIGSYALENGISRKGKEGEIRASLGTAIVNLLSSTLLNNTSNVRSDVLDNVLERLDKLESLTSTLLSKLPVSIESTEALAIENIPSDDSSNSESIADVVPITQVDATEQVTGEILQSYSFTEFHSLLGIPTPANKTKANGDIAITIARDKGLGDWEMNSTSRKFTKITGD